MKKIRAITCQVIHQEWEYEVEVPDDFEIKEIPSNDQAQYILSKIYNEGIEGQCLNNDEIRDEILVEYNEI